MRSSETGLGVSGGAGAEFAEPDIPQRWRFGEERALGLKLAKACDKPDKQSSDFPGDPSPFWIRDAAHSQFDEAILKAGARDQKSEPHRASRHRLFRSRDDAAVPQSDPAKEFR